MRGTLIVVYYKPDDLEVMEEFAKVVFGFPETVLSVVDAVGGARKNMEKLHKLSYDKGMNFMPMESVDDIESLFAPDEVYKLNIKKTGDFDPKLIAADLKEEKTVCVIIGEDIEAFKAEEVSLDVKMGPVGSVAVFLYEIEKYIE